MSDDIRKVFEQLNEVHIPFIVLKGWAFGGDLYQKLGDRGISDLDILVKSDQLKDVISALKKVGFYMVEPKSVFSGSQKNTNDTIPLALNFRSKSGVFIDLHTHVFTSPWLLPVYPIKMDDLWKEKSLFTDWDGNSIYRLSLEHNFMHLVSHIIRHGLTSNVLKSYQDLDILINKYSNEINWTKVIENSINWRMMKGTYFVCVILNQVYKTIIPEELIILLKPNKLRIWLFGLTTSARNLKDGLKNKKYKMFIGKLVLIDRPIDIIISLLRPIFPSKEFTKSLYGKPTSLLSHWFQLIKYGIQY